MTTESRPTASDTSYPLGGCRALEELQRSVSEFQLDNGITCILLERHDVPVFSCVTHVNVGASDEVKGITGLAHVFEHMAFKGTPDVGTLDYESERPLLEEQESVFRELRDARLENSADPDRISLLEARLQDLETTAGTLVRNNEFVELLERHGAEGTNAGTSADHTAYYVSMPSNKTELWAWLESSRLQTPIFREFFKEKKVIMEERRQRTESDPMGRLIEEVLAAAFKAHPYGEPVIGHMSDIAHVGMTEAASFHRRYYAGKNITLVLAGDVYPDEVRPILEQYFGSIPAGEISKPVPTTEPTQAAERRIIMKDASQPVMLLAFHRPSGLHPDSPVYEAISELLSGGKSARLQRRLVKEDRSAMAVGVINGYPGSKYPCLFLAYGIPNSGHTPEEVEKATLEELERLGRETVTQEELQAVNSRVLARLYETISTNQGLATLLARREVLGGGWRKAFTIANEIARVTPEDIQRVAQDCFRRSNLTAGIIIHETEDSLS